MLHFNLALIRPCLNREPVDKSAVSRSRLLCVYPHAYIAPYSFQLLRTVMSAWLQNDCNLHYRCRNPSVQEIFAVSLDGFEVRAWRMETIVLHGSPDHAVISPGWLPLRIRYLKPSGFRPLPGKAGQGSGVFERLKMYRIPFRAPIPCYGWSLAGGVCPHQAAMHGTQT